jgi:hypothetical protein
VDLLLTFLQVGIISVLAPGCTTPGNIALFTNIAALRPWIDRIITSAARY